MKVENVIMQEFFRINVSKYDKSKSFDVVRPSSLNNPKDNSVMFITKPFIEKWESVLKVKNCIVIWPDDVEIPDEVKERHAVIISDEPRKGFAEFFYNNKIVYNQPISEYEIVNGAYICKESSIGDNCTIFPGAYIDSQVKIGNNCYIASGVKIMGKVTIGDNCIIRENTVVGSDGLTTRKNDSGKVMTIPQFGGVIIEDNVQIGANTVICKGAIDDTVIRCGCRIDNCCFISHNVQIGNDSLVVGETLMMGSSSTGEQAYISGGVTIRDGVRVGAKAFIGMGAVVTKDIPQECKVKGNPARAF